MDFVSSRFSNCENLCCFNYHNLMKVKVLMTQIPKSSNVHVWNWNVPLSLEFFNDHSQEFGAFWKKLKELINISIAKALLANVLKIFLPTVLNKDHVIWCKSRIKNYFDKKDEFIAKSHSKTCLEVRINSPKNKKVLP